MQWTACINNSNIPKKEARAKALKYADEIAANLTHGTILFLEFVLSWVWNKIYKGIQIHNINHLQEIHKDNEYLCPLSQKSHRLPAIVFCTLQKRLTVPHIAGINLNMPIVGAILRRGGAFFMRRSFKDNPLYSAVFDEYLHIILTQGYSLEYFVEGGAADRGAHCPLRSACWR